MRAPMFVFCLGLLLAGVAPAQESLGVRLVGSCSAVVDPCGVVVQGDYAYVADGGGGFRVISISDPAHPVQVGHCSASGSAQDVAVSGDYAYVAAFLVGLSVISVADPANPTQVGFLGTFAAWGVAVESGYVYVADGDSGLRVVSVADPANPVEVGHWNTPWLARGVAVYGDHAYVAIYQEGLRVISIADPANPTEVGYLQYPFHAWSVAAESASVYVGAGGLRVVSVADPAHPVQVGYCDTQYVAWNTAIDGDSAYIAAGDSGLRVISIAESTHPVEVGYYVRDASPAHGVAARGGYIYVGNGGLRIYQCYVPGVEEQSDAELRVANQIPTVVRGVLVLGAVDSRQNAGYRAELLDVAGRRALDLKPGANDVRALAPGVYFVRGEGRGTGEEGRIRKVVLTR